MATSNSSLDTATLIHAALSEDIGAGDVTSLATVPAFRKASAAIVAKADGVIAGVSTARDTFLAVDPALQLTIQVEDGTKVSPGDTVLEVQGSARSILTAERTALNFLGRLSGIASLTARYVEAVSGTGVRILDTRKTTPGMRLLEKAAVVAGGGKNHRVGLFDMVLIKENHIRGAGSITAAINQCREYLESHQTRTTIRVEVETTSLKEVDEALNAGCDRIMLDNMNLKTMQQACTRIRSYAPGTEIEASGNMTVDRVRVVAETGIHFVSVGALTHSAPALDLSLLFEKEQSQVHA